MNKKTIAVFAVCMLLVAALSVFATLAYLQDSETITNTFTSGNVTITLDETKIGPDLMTPATGEAAGRTSDNQSYRVYPGQEYVKDPMITINAGSEQAYVGAVVSIKKASVLEAVGITEDSVLDFLGIAPISGWTLNKQATDASDAYVFTYVYGTAMNAESNIKVFESFKVDADATNEQVAALNDLQIIVTAYAVQTQTFNNGAAEALNAAFPTVFTYTAA